MFSIIIMQNKYFRHLQYVRFFQIFLYCKVYFAILIESNFWLGLYALRILDKCICFCRLRFSDQLQTVVNYGQDIYLVESQFTLIVLALLGKSSLALVRRLFY